MHLIGDKRISSYELLQEFECIPDPENPEGNTELALVNAVRDLESQVGENLEDFGLHGISEIIREDDFVSYTQELIEDCYENVPPKSNDWPYKHMTVDYEAAAADLRSAQFDEVDLVGVDGKTYTYLYEAG